MQGFTSTTLSYPEVYFSGEDWKNRLIQDLDKAENYIVSCFFLGSICDENREIFDKLEEKASEGVDIYLITDGVGAMDMTESRYHIIPLSTLNNSHIHLLEFNPLSVNRIINVGRMFQREHRKFWVIDGYKISVGGMNVNYSSISAPEQGGQRDSMYVFESNEIGQTLTNDFVEYWNQNSWEEIRENQLVPKTVEIENPIKGWLFNQYSDKKSMSSMYGSVFALAKDSIDILPFMPAVTEPMFNMLQNLTNEGVDIKMIIPQDPRQTLSACSQFVSKDLKQNGVRVFFEDYEENPPFLHEKLAIIDKKYVIFGSTNFNMRSMDLSNEIAIVVENDEFAKELQFHFDELLSNSKEISLEKAQDWKTFDRFLKSIFSYVGG